MQDRRTLSASGVLAGPVDVAGPVTWGTARFWPQDGEVHFALTLDLPVGSPKDVSELLERVAPAVRAGVAAACGAAVEARVTGWAVGDGRSATVGAARSASWSVRVRLDGGPPAAAQGEAALTAVLGGSDRRLAQLYEVYLLGVQAVQTVAPVVGLWAFTSVLEEEAPPKTYNLRHVPELVRQLQAEGYALPPTPARHLDQIRSAALHPTPKDPLPTPEEVSWFRDVTRAYLLRRATTPGRVLTPARSKVKSPPKPATRHGEGAGPPADPHR